MAKCRDGPLSPRPVRPVQPRPTSVDDAVRADVARLRENVTGAAPAAGTATKRRGYPPVIAGTEEEPVKPASTACTEVDNKVIRFQPRASAVGLRKSTRQSQDICQILSLSKYERPRVVVATGGTPVSVGALIFATILAIVGAWIVFDIETRPACASITMCPQRSHAASF
jgi:hypothetical protein